MQHLLRSIYNNQWFPFQTIPLLSSPKSTPASSPAVDLSPSLSSSSSSSSSSGNSTLRPSLTPTEEGDHHFQLDSSDQFHLLQITSTSLSISVSLPSSYLNNQLIHPLINLNSQPWSKLLLLDQSQPSNRASHPDQDGTSLASLTILIYGLEPGTVYDVDLELNLVDQHPALNLASNSSLRNQPTDDIQHNLPQKLDSTSTTRLELNDQPPARQHSHRLKLSDARARSQTSIPHMDPDGPPPPYTSYDPASPTQTCTSDVVRSSSHSFSPLESSFAEITSTETSLDASTLPAPRSDNTNEEDQAMRTEVEKQALALREAIEENAPLKQSLCDLEQLIKRLDEENVTKSAALLSYDEPKMVEFEKRIEDQKEKLKRKTEEYNALEQKNQRKLDTLKQNNQLLKTRWEESIQRVGDLKEKTLKPTEEEIEELTRQLSECEKEIKSIDRETQKRAIEHSNQFQIVRSRSASKKPNLIPSTSNSRGTSNDSAHKEASKNRRQSKWRSMDDFKSMNPSLVRRNHSGKTVALDEKTPAGSTTVVAQQQPKILYQHNRSRLNKSISIAACPSPNGSPEKKSRYMRGQLASTHSSLPATNTTAPTSTVTTPTPTTTTTTTTTPVNHSPSVPVGSVSAKTWAEKLAQS
ncbi:hypothetical protein PGTUg99_022014 [Puccinia graminis f. sp. tritici]|uniref:Uncharacterized protein n=1 Tax=Puccinia graminis f. sp. tritici TaxID=56615 RepID=A0A5B0QH25_PUCGR|nr:hypothetical protein PGTUg99_022014 [Puccinia graminis f. sp. tritici]